MLNTFVDVGEYFYEAIAFAALLYSTYRVWRYSTLNLDEVQKEKKEQAETSYRSKECAMKAYKRSMTYWRIKMALLPFAISLFWPLAIFIFAGINEGNNQKKQLADALEAIRLVENRYNVAEIVTAKAENREPNLLDLSGRPTYG